MLTKSVEEKIKKLLDINTVQLAKPRYENFGDISMNVMQFKKKSLSEPDDSHRKPLAPQNTYTVSPQTIADTLASDTFFERVEVVGAFVNLFVNRKKLAESISTKIPSISDARVMLEFAHPNTHKMFHIGHLRNIVLGESLCRIFTATGYHVIRANYQGDVGLHIAKCLYAIKQDIGDNSETLQTRFKTLEEKVAYLGNVYASGNSAFENEETAKQAIYEINKQIYQKDPSIHELWKETRQWSLDYFDSIYKRVYTTFDRLYFESEVAEKGLQIAKKATQDGILEEDDGAIILNGEKHGVDTRVFVNSLGLPTYEGKDLGLAMLEFTEFGTIDKCIHLVGSEQKSYFETVFTALTLIDPALYLDASGKSKQEHFAYGFVDLKGGKMSSRKGNVVPGNNLLDTIHTAIKEAFSLDNEAAEIVAIGAVKYAFLKVESTKNISFDINESISMHGNSGPYIQYAYARIQSVLEKSGFTASASSGLDNIHDSALDSLTDEDILLLRKLARYQEAVVEASESYSPHIICTYLFELTQAFNILYEKQPISHEKNVTKKETRLMIVHNTGKIMKSALDLLGIKVLSRL